MTWKELFGQEKTKDYFIELYSRVQKERKKHTVFPPKGEVFSAFTLTPFENVKVVIIGQDPYHNFNQAHGLAFSVKDTKMPPSLRNIFKELESDLGIKRTNTNLTGWAKEGVLLLNTILTVRAHAPLSHNKIGWQKFTDQVIKTINSKKDHVVFILWGNNAIAYERLITKPSHLIIKSSHPSPLSARRSFFGSKPFSKTNEYLKKHNLKPIDWSK